MVKELADLRLPIAAGANRYSPCSDTGRTVSARHTKWCAGGFRISGPGTPRSALRLSHSTGMTFIEVIVVILIIGILAATVIPKIGSDTASGASVGGAAYMIASDIRYAQEFAMANRVSKEIRFSLNSDVYTFFPANAFDPSGQLQGARTGAAITFRFNSLGEPTLNGGGSVTVSDGTTTKTISVESYTGKVTIS